MPEFEPRLSAGAIAIFVVLMTRREEMTREAIGAALGVKESNTHLGVLKKNGLVEHGARVGRTVTYRLSESGWRRCGEVIGANVKGSGAAANALLMLLHDLARGFTAHGITAETFFRPATVDDDRATVDDDRATVDDDPDSLIRKVYADLTRTAGDWVPLADIRDRLGGLDGGDVGRALVAMARHDPHVKLIAWDNRKALTDRDRAGAVRFGGVDAHALRIESR
jgi:hypothetical protein